MFNLIYTLKGRAHFLKESVLEKAPFLALFQTSLTPLKMIVARRFFHKFLDHYSKIHVVKITQKDEVLGILQLKKWGPFFLTQSISLKIKSYRTSLYKYLSIYSSYFHPIRFFYQSVVYETQCAREHTHTHNYTLN